MDILFFIVLILITRCSAKCMGSLAVEPFSKHGHKFDKAYCKVFGAFLSDYDDPEQIYIEEKRQFCSCVDELECVDDTVYNLAPTSVKQCPGEKVCCLYDPSNYDEDELECPDKEPKPSYFKTNYGDLKCVYSAAENAPFVVAVIDERARVRCGGVIIHPRIVVTDSACLNNTSAKLKKVTTVNKISKGNKTKRVTSFIKDYKTEHFVTLLHLESPLDFSSELVRPACLSAPSQHGDVDDDFSDNGAFEICAHCVAYTWPNIPRLSVNKRVQRSKIDLMTDSYCLKQLGMQDEKKYENISKICAGFKSEEKCKEIGLGKSGMPVLCQLQDRPEGHLSVAGITATFPRCDTDQPVAFFTRLPINWIHTELNKTWGYNLL